MSATLGTLLHMLAPALRIATVEAMPQASSESSDAWNNAGTGHSALCELNYTPQAADGSVATARAIDINEQFQLSRQFWATLAETGVLPEPGQFIHAIPHMSFVAGADAVDFLRRRHEALRTSPLFAGMQYTEAPEMLRAWIPLMMEGRSAATPVAATRSDEGTDLDFGALTRLLFGAMQARGSSLHFGQRATNLTRQPDGQWLVETEDMLARTKRQVRARFVFLGAGGAALLLLQKSGIPEGRGYGGFPVSGQWLRCTNREVIEKHAAKVYGKPALGAPPMSVPHLDTRVIEGRRELLFGPFAGFSSKFLKHGSYTDLLRSICPGNLRAMLGAGAGNVALTRYLVGQILQSPSQRMEALREFVPNARNQDWELAVAGQRVQIIKPDAKKGGVLEFGTEVIRSADGSLAALLGASPGASTAVAIMLKLLRAGLPVLTQAEASPAAIQRIVPSYGESLHSNPALLQQVTSRTNALLKLS